MSNHTSHVSVLGLGAMGTAIARAMLRAGHDTTVWNRTASRATPVAAQGATAVASAADAFSASPLTILSLLDADAVLEVLAAAGESVAGRTVVDFTSTTPADATRIHDAVAALGGTPLVGAVMGTPPLIGTDDMLVLYSGARKVFDRVLPTVDALGGQSTWVGAAPSAAAVLDLGMLDIFYAGATAFLHGAALAHSDGMSATEFLGYARPMLDLVALTATELAEEIDTATYPGDDNNLRMMLRGIEHVVEASEAAGLDPSLPAVTRNLMRAAVDGGHGADGYGRLIEIIRARTSGPATATASRGSN